MSALEQVLQASAIAIEGRAMMITGRPGAGKSSLVLGLIDRGARLIGDDGVSLSAQAGQVIASPPPNISGKLEIRGVGIVALEPVSAALALVLDLDSEPERLPPAPLPTRELLGCAIPLLPFDMRAPEPALRAEWALRLHGLVG